jgi:hypothetical protein
MVPDHNADAFKGVPMAENKIGTNLLDRYALHRTISLQY